MSARYKLVKAPAHPKATSNGFVYEHVLVVEAALGHSLPDGAEIHHIDENTRNNAPTNLVACQNDAYHKLLHVRARALAACGNPSWRKCCMCKRYDDPANLKSKQSGTTGRTFYHNACAADYQRKLKERRGGVDITREQADANPERWLALGQPWLVAGAATE